MDRNLKDYGLLLLKGMGMGAADVVPGVSGGTIAFIVGIYEELIDSIKSINGASLKLLFTGKIAAFWKAINANFLLAIVAGIGISIFSLAKLITWLLVTHPIGVGLLFRVGTGFHLVRIERYQTMELEIDTEFYHRGYHCLLHYRCHTGGDTDKSVLYLPLRSHCDLRDDLAGYFR